MTGTAKHYVALIAALGLVILIDGISQWQCSNPAKFLCYLGLAVFASTRKVRLPGVTGTYSANFLFILLGITSLSLPEAITIGCVSIITQSVWKTTTRPRPVQVLFNVGNIVISIAGSYFGTHLIEQPKSSGGSLVMLAFAASLFFLLNTLLVSGVLSMIGRKALQEVWSQWILWTFPYYLAGIAVAGLMTVSNQHLGWAVSLSCLPLMYLASLWYQRFIACHTPSPADARG